MNGNLFNLTPENLADEHLCCIIRSHKRHPGVEAKRQWLSARLPEGHVFRKLDQRATVFIEYAPLETAWVPVVGDKYLYLYCLWVLRDQRNRGYGRALMEHCVADALTQGRSGVCMLGAVKQRAWLSDQSFARHFGFETVDTAGDYELLALSFDGTKPRFTEAAKRQTIDSQDLTVFYSPQCPYIHQTVETIRQYCAERAIPLSVIPVDSLEKAKALPCPFNNFALFYRGKFQTVNLIDTGPLGRILSKND
jgi:GNAT superfamily N-acetyltransferase